MKVKEMVKSEEKWRKGKGREKRGEGEEEEEGGGERGEI